ncbi:MAG: NADH-quinone oxidoreductase subunit NuoF [Nitrospirota bacterium]
MTKGNGHTKIIIGMGTCGLSAGAKDIYEEASLFVKKKGLNADIIPTGCIGMCHKEIMLDIEVPQRTRVSYGEVRRDDVSEILKTHIIKKQVMKEKVVGQMRSDDSDISPYPRIPFFEDLPYNNRQKRIVLSNCGYIDPRSIDDYMDRDGYIAIRRVLSSFTPEKVIEVIKRSGLRGRGGAGFPTWKKWEFCRNADGDTKYLICNADEGDPGAFMDRSVLEGDPHSLIEGMIIAAFAIGASRGYIYVRAEYPLAIERLETALFYTEERGLLGNNILGKGFDFDIELRHGAGAFVCGEETALIASIDGERGMPKPKPPFPAISGLWNRPTNINNVETLANIPRIISNGSDWYGAFGTDKSKGTKTFALTGDINNPGLIEVPMGISLKEIIYDIGGGIAGNRALKAVQTGGPSGGCIPAELIDTPIDYESLSTIGTIMGSGGMVVLDDTTCMVDMARYFLKFDMEESCGKCTPCRIGTKRMVEILERISNRKGREGDIDLLIDIGKDIKDTSLCGLGQTAPTPVLTTIKYFREEYEQHIKEKRCPTRGCLGKNKEKDKYLAKPKS